MTEPNLREMYAVAGRGYSTETLPLRRADPPPRAPRRTPPRLAKARADGSLVATRWQCPCCERYGRSYVDNLEHIAIEMRFVLAEAELPEEIRAKYTRPKAPLKPRAIKRVKLQDRVRYRFVVDVGKKPDGRRDQRTFTCDTIEEAVAERARIIAEVRTGTFVQAPKRRQRATLRCVGKTRAGSRCKRWSLPHSDRCGFHPAGVAESVAA